MAGSWGGYEYQFVTTPPDWLMCRICHFPSREPYLSECCGHTFCESCLEGVKEAATGTDCCPMCRHKQFVTIANKQADRLVKTLLVFCTNKEKGCRWQGELNDIIGHLRNSNGCLFEDLKCSNNCGITLHRQNLTNHVKSECPRRKVVCQYCRITGEHHFVSSEHKDQCPMFPIQCPNNCKAHNILRKDFNEHRKVCPLEEVTCPNNCGVTIQQQNLLDHVKQDCPQRRVTCQYCSIMAEHQFIQCDHKSQCPKLPVNCPNECDVGSVLREDLEEHMKICILEEVQCEYHVVGCKDRVARKDQKKHNEGKTAEHLSLTTHQIICTQEYLASNQVDAVNSRAELAAKVGHELASTKQELSTGQHNAVKKIDKLFLRLQQTERDFATKEELIALQHEVRQCKQFLTQIFAKIEQVSNESEEQLAGTENVLTLKLQQTDYELALVRQELDTTKESLIDAQNNLAIMQESLSSAKRELANTKTLLRATQQESQRTRDEFVQRLNIESNLNQKITEIESKLQQQDRTRQNECMLFNRWYKAIYTTATKLSSGDQAVPVVVCMSDYAHKKRNKISWFSDSFYTHHKGYRLCINVSFAEPHMLVGLVVMKGPHDDKLKWPLNGQCEVKLLNQISNNENYSVTGHYFESGHKRVTAGERSGHYMWSSANFIDEEDLHKIALTCQFLKDDSIFLHVTYKQHS
ncbi:TNF receptor-associated factor 3-like [Dysidea avara]|uniref:TNF receptor-associated factor 3-like n=1 Tax=Dysidea avara TaxID=196820 RepID=UPI00332A0294